MEGRVHVAFRPAVMHLPLLADGVVGPADQRSQTAAALEMRQRLRALQAVHMRRAREHFPAFMQYCFIDPTKGKPFAQQWFHDEWSAAMDTGNRVLIIAPRDHGKCQVGETIIELANGRVAVKDFRGGQILALDPATMRVVVARASAPFEAGERAVFRVETASGRAVIVTGNHPFLRGIEWVEAQDLQVGDRVGVMVGAATLPEGGGDLDEAWVLGFLVGNGCLTHESSVSTTDPPCQARLAAFAQARGWTFADSNGNAWRFSNDWRRDGNGPRDWLRDHDLLGCSAHTKRVPDAVWAWGRNAQLAFLSGYFDADGGVESRGEQVSFSSVSRDLLADVQALLARCGINGTLRKKAGTYNGERHWSWRIFVRGVDLARFQAGYSGASRKADALRQARGGGYGGGRLDLVPYDAWRPLVTISQRAGRAVGMRFDSARAITKCKVRRLAETCGSAPLAAIADAEVAWEQVVAITPAGREMTYGIEVAGHHNHITDGIITHNTSQIVGRTIWELGRHPDLRVKIACASDGRAKERLYEVVQHLENNPRIQEVFPNLKRADFGEWSKHKIVVRRSVPHRDASVEALGITSTATGGRADLLIADDAVDRRNALSFPALREQIKQAWRSDWTNLLEPESRVWYICTLWHKDDLSHQLMGNPAYQKLFYAIDADFGAMWPEKWTEASLRLRHAEIGSVEFNRGFRNQAVDDESQTVRAGWVKFADLTKDERFLAPLAAGSLVFFTSYDAASTPTGKKEQDYSSSCTIAVDVDAHRVFIVDAWHARLSLSGMSDQVVREYRKYKPFRILIEKVGLSALDEWVLNNEPDLAGVVEVTKPRISKAQRLLAVTPIMERGDVIFSRYLDPDADTWDPARGSLVHELLDFPFAKHDDMVDAFSQALDGARRYFLDAWATGEDNVVDLRVGPGPGERAYPF